MGQRGKADEQDREGILGGVGIACGFRRRVSGDTMTNTRDLQPGEKWQFKAGIIEGGDTYKDCYAVVSGERYAGARSGGGAPTSPA
jgi:hypothetical protein